MAHQLFPRPFRRSVMALYVVCVYVDYSASSNVGGDTLRALRQSGHGSSMLMLAWTWFAYAVLAVAAVAFVLKLGVIGWLSYRFIRG